MTLLGAGANIEDQDAEHYTALTVATSCRYLETAELLIERDARMNANFERIPTGASWYSQVNCASDSRRLRS